MRSRQRNTKRHRQQIHLYFYGFPYVESEVAIISCFEYDCFWLPYVRVKTLEGKRSTYDWNWLQRGTTFRDSEDVYFPLHITPIISDASMEERKGYQIFWCEKCLWGKWKATQKYSQICFWRDSELIDLEIKNFSEKRIFKLSWVWVFLAGNLVLLQTELESCSFIDWFSFGLNFL